MGGRREWGWGVEIVGGSGDDARAMKNRALPLAASLLFLVLGSCAALRPLAEGSLQKPTLKFESWAARDLDLDGVTIALHYTLENPNPVGLDVKKFAYMLEVEGRQVVQGDLPGGIQAKAKGASPLTIPVRLRWMELPGFVEAVMTRRDLGYRVSGTVGIGWPLGVIDLPYEYSNRITLPRPPSIKLDGVSLTNVSLSAVTLAVNLRIGNPNGFALPTGALQYALKVAGRDLVTGASSQLTGVVAGGNSVVTIPAKVSTVGLALGASSITKGADVRLKGNAGFGALKLPIDQLAKIK